MIKKDINNAVGYINNLYPTFKYTSDMNIISEYYINVFPILEKYIDNIVYVNSNKIRFAGCDVRARFLGCPNIPFSEMLPWYKRFIELFPVDKFIYGGKYSTWFARDTTTKKYHVDSFSDIDPLSLNDERMKYLFKNAGVAELSAYIKCMMRANDQNEEFPDIKNELIKDREIMRNKLSDYIDNNNLPDKDKKRLHSELNAI